MLAQELLIEVEVWVLESPFGWLVVELASGFVLGIGILLCWWLVGFDWRRKSEHQAGEDDEGPY